MDVKLKEDGTLLPAAVVEDNNDLLLLLIREDLKAHKLAHILNEIIGSCECAYLPDLTDAVLDLAGFSEACRTNEFYDTYYKMMGKYIALLNGNDEVLARVAGVILLELRGIGDSLI